METTVQQVTHGFVNLFEKELDQVQSSLKEALYVFFIFFKSWSFSCLKIDEADARIQFTKKKFFFLLCFLERNKKKWELN